MSRAPSRCAPTQPISTCGGVQSSNGAQRVAVAAAAEAAASTALRRPATPSPAATAHHHRKLGFGGLVIGQQHSEALVRGMRHGWKRAPVRLKATEEVVMRTGTVRRQHRRQHRPRQEQLLNGGAEMLQAQTWRRRASHALPLLLHCGKSLECTCAMNRECSIARAWQWLLRHGPAGGNWWQRWRVPRCSALACCQHGQTQLSSHIDLGPFCSNISGRECLRNLARCHSCRSQFAAPSWRRQESAAAAARAPAALQAICAFT